MPAEPAHHDSSEYPSGPLIYEIARGRQRDQLAQREAYSTRSSAALKRLPPTKKRSGNRTAATDQKVAVPQPDPKLTGTQKRGFGIFKRGPNAA